MKTYSFRYYDHYTFGGMLVNINRMLINGAYYTLELNGRRDFIQSSFISGLFHNLNINEPQLDIWLVNESFTRIILKETKEPEFMQIKP